MVIPITLSVGLLVAAGYVGHRIVTAKSQPVQPVQNAVVAPPPAAKLAPVAEEPVVEEKVQATEAPRVQVQAPAPAVQHEPAAVPQAAPPSELVATQEQAAQENVLESVTDDGSALIDPQPGQRYLQIAAISSQAVTWFMADLRRNHLEVRLAPGPREGLRRVLIGPFPNWDSLNATKAQIQKMWPDCFVRVY